MCHRSRWQWGVIARQRSGPFSAAAETQSHAEPTERMRGRRKERRTKDTPLIQEETVDRDAAIWRLERTSVFSGIFLLLIPSAASSVAVFLHCSANTRPTAEVVFPRSQPVMMRSRADVAHLDCITAGWNVLRYHSCYLLREMEDSRRIQLSRGCLPSLRVFGGSPSTFLSFPLLSFG